MKMIDKMVSAFLGWKLPKDFAPDAGISFDRAYGDKWGMPSGTNLFHAEQAREMIQHMLSAACDEEYAASTEDDADSYARGYLDGNNSALADADVADDAEVKRLRACLSTVNDIRNSIIGLQRFNWSEHMYPLVAALDAAGIEGEKYPEAKAYVGTLLTRAIKAEDENTELTEKLTVMAEALKRIAKETGEFNIEAIADKALPMWEPVPNAEFCHHCSPCRNSERLAKAERLNIEYDAILRNLASYLGAGGFDSLLLIDPKTADEKIRWGIGHVVGVERNRAAAAAADAEAVPVAWADDRAIAGDVGNCASAAAKAYWERGDWVDKRGAEALRHPLYARPQPADVCVLVEALRKIADGAHAAGDIAQQALADWETK